MNKNFFDREQNELRILAKAKKLSDTTLRSKEEISGLLLGDSPEFADTKITSLAADGALGNSAKSVKSYLTQLWSKLSTHMGLTTTAHGGIVADNDSRLTDARTPTAHKSSHATGGGDALAPADIGAAPLNSPAFTGSPTAPTMKIGDASNYLEAENNSGFINLIGSARGYADIFFPHGLPKTTGTGNPSLVTYLGNLRGYAYAVNDAHDLDPQEYDHRLVISGDLIWHLHWLSRTDVAAERTVKFELERSYAAPNGVETLITPNATVEVTVPANTAANTHYLTNIVTDAITNIGPAYMLSARIKRIASSGTEPATDPIIKALHAHVKVDTPSGSRSVSSK